MQKYLFLVIVSLLVILSCKKDNGPTDDPSSGGSGSDKDWTISTNSTFLLKDVLDIAYVQDNKDDKKFEATVTLSKLSNKNNPNLKGEFQFVIDYDGKSNLNISQPIAFSNSDFVSKESVEKNVSIVLPGNTSKIGTIKMKMREKLNDKWTEYKYADKTYMTAYVKAETPTIEGPEQVDNEAIYTIKNAADVVLENADKIATLTKVSDAQYKVTKIATAYGTITIKATNKDNVSVIKEVIIGVPLPDINGPESLETEATYTINNAATVVLENNSDIASLTKVNETSWKVTKIGTAYGKVTIKATNKAGAIVTKEITIGVALPTITGAASFETEATYTITNATTVALENNSNIASLTKHTETTWKVTKIGTAYGKVTIKATNKAGAIATKEITVGVPLPAIAGVASFETEATYTITNATTVVLENNNNIANLTKLTETSWKVTKIGTAYGKVTIKATNKAGAIATKEITVGTAPLPAPTIEGSATVCQEEIYTIKNATTVTLENANGIATLTSLGNDLYKVTKVGNGSVILKATNSNSLSTTKSVFIGIDKNRDILDYNNNSVTNLKLKKGTAYNFHISSEFENENYIWSITINGITTEYKTSAIFFSIPEFEHDITVFISINILISNPCASFSISRNFNIPGSNTI